MNTNDFYELKKSYDTSQMPEKEVIKMKEKMNQAKAEKKNKHNKTIITRIWVGAAAAIAAFVILPNTSPSVAYAMEQIPLLGNLIEVVTFRDYQYSSDRNNADVNVPKLVPETVASTEITTEEPVGENLKKSTDEINAEIDELVDLKRDIRELIAQIRKPEYRTLLELRYLGFRTWDAIAEEMGFEPRTIYRFHSNALRVVERLMRAEKNS